VGPSEACLECVHVGVGQGLKSVITDGGIGDDAAGGVEAIDVEAEKEAVAGRGLIIEAGRHDQVIALAGACAEIRVQGKDGVRHLLEIEGI